MYPAKIYNQFHRKTKSQKKVINEKNFTYRNLLSIIKQQLKNKIFSTVLDVGCGAGTISFYLASRGFNVLGLDISAKAIKMCKETARNLRLENRTKFIKGTLTTIKPDNKFDLIICSEVIEHIPHDKNFLMKLYRVLKKGGILILSTPSSNAPLYKIGFAHKFDQEVGHLRRYSINELIKLLKSTGFSIREVKKTEGVLRNFLFLSRLRWFIKFFKGIISDFMTILDNMLIKLFGESQIFIVARK